MADSTSAGGIKKRVRRPFTCTEKTIICNMFHTLKNITPTASHNDICKTVASSMGVHWVSVYKLVKEVAVNGMVKSPKRTKPRPSVLDKIDDYTKCAIRVIVQNFYLRNEIPTLDKILRAIEQDGTLGTYKRSTLHKILQNIGFKFTERNRNSGNSFSENCETKKVEQIEIDQGTVIILDMGNNTLARIENKEKCFFDIARECAARIIEHKIMSESKNYVGVILMGSKKFSGDFKYIDIFAELQTPAWQMIRNLPEEASTAKGNWFEALLAAVNHFKTRSSNEKFIRKNIILLSNFENPSYLEDDQIRKALYGFKEEGFEVDVIGPDIYSEMNKKNIDIEFARMFVEGTNGASATVEYTMKNLLFHRKKVTDVESWNVDLSIGSNIKIPLSVYIRLEDESVVKSWLKCVKDPVCNTAILTEAIMKDKMYINPENQSVVDNSNVIKGYCYGQQIIPFSDCDKNMLYDSGQKSLNLYGFTDANKITWNCLNGEGLSYVFGQRDDKKAEYTVKCLAECLHELNLVGIVRRVYNNGNAPNMFALMPVSDANFVCLAMAEICYKEDLKHIIFPVTNIKKYSVNDEQVQAFKDLIQSMDLTKAYQDSEYDDTEAFPIAETVSPSAQYVLDCIAYRAMNPGKPLPSPRDDLMLLFKVPPSIEKRCRDPLEKLKKLFDLKKVESNSKKKSVHMDDEEPSTSKNDTNLDGTTKHNIKQVGTIDPVGDFDVLKGQGKPFNELALEMTEAIECMIYTNFDDIYGRAFEAMTHFKQECIKTDPSYYNNWLKNFEIELQLRNKSNILNLIVENNIGLIIKHEDEARMYDRDNEESRLYECDTLPELSGGRIRSKVSNMFDHI